jgi:hypothetical protein
VDDRIDWVGRVESPKLVVRPLRSDNRRNRSSNTCNQQNRDHHKTPLDQRKRNVGSGTVIQQGGHLLVRHLTISECLNFSIRIEGPFGHLLAEEGRISVRKEMLMDKGKMSEIQRKQD